jgi:hypothetical protein
MEVYVNERRVKVSTEIGRWSLLGGLIVLVVGFVVQIGNPELVWVGLLALPVGFLASVIGAYYANHWTRQPRADEVLSGALKGISNKYHLYHYLLPVSHVLLGPSGMFLFRAFLHEGPVVYDGKRWRQKKSIARFLGITGQDPLVDPVLDTLKDVQRFRRWLSKRMPENQIPEIRPFAVFVRDGVELELEETPIPVLRYKQLKSHIRRFDKECREPLDEGVLYNIERAMLGDRIDEL